MSYVGSNNQSLKYQRFTTSGYKDIRDYKKEISDHCSSTLLLIVISSICFSNFLFLIGAYLSSFSYDYMFTDVIVRLVNHCQGQFVVKQVLDGGGGLNNS